MISASFDVFEKLAEETLADAKNEFINNPFYDHDSASEILQRFLSHIYELSTESGDNSQ